eukprot:scaffold40015_cov29-Tisochrysis_lutea.AAC.3
MANPMLAILPPAQHCGHFLETLFHALKEQRLHARRASAMMENPWGSVELRTRWSPMQISSGPEMVPTGSNDWSNVAKSHGASRKWVFLGVRRTMLRNAHLFSSGAE